MRTFATQVALVALFLCLQSATLTTAQTGPPPPMTTTPPTTAMVVPSQSPTAMPYWTTTSMPETSEEDESEEEEKNGMVFWVNGQLQVNGLGVLNGKPLMDMLMGGKKIKAMEKKLEEMKEMHGEDEKMEALGMIVRMFLDKVREMKMEEGMEEIEAWVENMNGTSGDDRKAKMEKILAEIVKKAIEIQVEGEEEDMEKLKEMVKEMKEKHGGEKVEVMRKLVKMLVWHLKRMEKMMMCTEWMEKMKGGEWMQEWSKMDMMKMKMMEMMEKMEMKGDMAMGEMLEKVKKMKELKECIETLKMMAWLKKMREEEEMGWMAGLWGSKDDSLFRTSGAGRALPLSLTLTVLALCTRALFL